MTDSPDYIAQTGEHWPYPDYSEYRSWVDQRCLEAGGRGCEIVRVTADPDRALVIVEGWKDFRADQSASPAWQMTDGVA